MYLKKLTLRGFKSFASTTSLVLEPGITCVVGPNGSGKSNVVDALTWVMGEQGAKSLRGGSMEDVIFAGTSARAPLGRAEIQLTIDNSDGALPIDYSEVTISRTKFRNGNSEYAINGTVCRLLDVRELLSDSGIGREMHVVVGQGELDQILQATPETRRGFVEEAAGVLKHRERKEKALRKLDATQANLHRLTDLISEIRRQLKPLGRQAEVAKRASAVQADLRDAKARLLADDLTQAHEVLAAEMADEHSIQARRIKVEADLVQARLEEDEGRLGAIDKESAYRRTQETWFSLTAIAERVHSVISLAQERVRSAEAMPIVSTNPARDPDTLLAQAVSMREEEAALRDEISKRAEKLTKTTTTRQDAEAAHQAAAQEFETLVRARSTSREDHARLVGELSSTKHRSENQAVRLHELVQAHSEAQQRADRAAEELADQEAELPNVDLSNLASKRDQAEQGLDQARTTRDEAKARVSACVERRAGLVARIEALELALQSNRDGSTWLVKESKISGILGSLASLIRVESGYEKAVAAGLGTAGEAVVMKDLDCSMKAMDVVHAKDHGRAEVVYAPSSVPSRPHPPTGSRGLLSVISAEKPVLSAVAGLLGSTVVVDSLSEGRTLVEKNPELRFVTINGETLTAGHISGGSQSQPSAIQLASTLVAAQKELSMVDSELRQVEAEVDSCEMEFTKAQDLSFQAATEYKEAEAAYSATSTQLAALRQASVLAETDVERYSQQIETSSQELDDIRRLAEQLEQRISLAEPGLDVDLPDSSHRDELAEQAKQARSHEVEARLGLTTLEERVRSLAGQVENLTKTAETERAARQDAERRREHIQHRAEVASKAEEAALWLDERIASSLAIAEEHRSELNQARTLAETSAESARRRVRDLSEELQTIVDSAHHDELALAQQKMRIDALSQRVMDEVGLDVEALMATYGPQCLIPVGEADPETGETESIPFVREDQMKRLRTAERDLQLLGRINPLALEEFDAMQERHRFLSSQLEDLKKTRVDLLSIIDEVDARVQEVFSQAYKDVEREFASTFSRLFPGGEGRLLLTEPDEWLTTGIEVEARPAGKKVKRLSLLSGGERALVAVCFLISLFKARPSPFYVLDEVEAALDDTNVGRLLGIYEELRATSQLVIITHQKRTMEIADTLYGVSMGSDGTSTVVSQRLREE